jgi:hypothetical protein
MDQTLPDILCMQSSTGATIMEKIREAAVAGTFYPADPEELQSMLHNYLAESASDGSPPKAMIVPHAGYIYSGLSTGLQHRVPLVLKPRSAPYPLIALQSVTSSPCRRYI